MEEKVSSEIAPASQPAHNSLSVPGIEPQKPGKPIHTIVLDSSPLLLNSPPLSTLLSQSQALLTTPSVVTEIRDPDARSRVETLYSPFLTIRTPRPESIKIVKEFARRTGDAAVLSTVDLEILALAYDLECEKNGGDWRLRKVPGQKRLNGSPPAREETSTVGADGLNVTKPEGQAELSADFVANSLQGINLQDTQPAQAQTSEVESANSVGPLLPEEDHQLSSDSDSEGWITPSNIKKHQAEDDSSSAATKRESKVLQVATITGDFAMQNVLLQMNLNLLSAKTCKRISTLKQTILRCHGCFATTKEMDKRFCPRCGKPTLTRVSCTTNDKGEVKLHLKANMQWNNKGNVFSIPKPVGGSSNQKWKGSRDGGGQGGWGSDLILAEDQKEYVRAMTAGQRRKEKNLMDDDYLPSLLTGERDKGSGRVKVGAGRNVNSKRR